MWTADNRPRYNRDKLRYPSDLTDAEWAHIEPLIPPGKPGGGKRRVAIREVINGVMYILSTGCQWRALPKDLAEAPCYLPVELGTARWISIHCALPQVPRESRARSQPHGLSTVRVLKKGGSLDSHLRCRQADQGQEAACSGRYARLAAARHRHRRRRSGSRRRSRAAGDLVRSVSLSREIVRRQRLSGARSFTAPWPASCPSRPRSSSAIG